MANHCGDPLEYDKSERHTFVFYEAYIQALFRGMFCINHKLRSRVVLGAVEGSHDTPALSCLLYQMELSLAAILMLLTCFCKCCGFLCHGEIPKAVVVTDPPTLMCAFCTVM